MEIDEKHAVLFAVYAEDLKAIPDMTSLTPARLNMDPRAFNIAFQKLQRDGFIDGLETVPPHTKTEPALVMLDGVGPTYRGTEYVKRKLGLSEMGVAQEHLRELKEKFREYRWEALHNLVADILSHRV